MNEELCSECGKSKTYWGTTYEDCTDVDITTAFDALRGKDHDAMMFQLLGAVARNLSRIADSHRRMEAR